MLQKSLASRPPACGVIFTICLGSSSFFFFPEEFVTED
jgi:hypothetical protein